MLDVDDTKQKMRSLIGYIILWWCSIACLQAQQTQWASRVIAFSSQYGNKEYAATQALGVPNAVGSSRLNHMAWVPRKEENITGEYIRVGFDNPMRIRQLAIAESLNPGAIHRIILFDESGKRYKIYENNNPRGTMAPFRLFRHNFPLTDYKVAELKLELKTKAVKGSNQIDAIGISASSSPIQAKLKQSSSSDQGLRPENLGPKINSTYAERLPLISPDGQTLYFARKYHPQNFGSDNNDDIWVAFREEDGNWGAAINVGAPLNTNDHNFVIGMNPTGKTIYLANNYRSPGKAGVSVSHKQGRSWTRPKPLNIQDHYNHNQFVNYYMSIDEDILLMAVERDEGLGDLDLYVSFKQAAQQWTTPQSLGNIINTIGIESSIFLAADGRTIYFSSNGHQGYGGLDMFMSRRLDDSWTNWSEPVNLGPQINNANNNYNYSIPASGDFAYFSSDDANGMSNLFRIRLPEDMRPEPVMLVTGQIIDAETQRPIEAQLQLSSLAQSKQQRKMDAPDGQYQMVLPYGENLGIYAEIDGYFSVSESMELEGTSLEGLDGDQQHLIASANSDDTFAVQNTEIDRLQLRLNKLDNELRRLELEKNRAQTKVESPTNTESQSAQSSYRTDPELEALKHRYQQLQQNKQDIKETKQSASSAASQPTDDKELAAMRAKYDKIYNSPSPSPNKQTTDQPNKREDKELRSMRDKLKQFYDKDEKPSTKQKDDLPPKVQRPSSPPSEPADDFESIKKIVRQQLKNELRPDIRQELQNELLSRIALDVERELDDETRAKISNRMRADIKKQLKSDLQKRNRKSRQQIEKLELPENQLPTGFEKSMRQALMDEVKDELRSELHDRVQESLYTELKYRIKKALEEQYRKELQDKINEQKQQDKPFKPVATAPQAVIPESTPGPAIYQELEQDILLVPIKVGQIIPMNNIFFDANKSTLKPASTAELERVLAFLQKKSNLIIEVGGHTNGWCSSSFAHELSMDRSKAVADYLIEHGISEHRIQFRGYGKTKPVATNDTIAGRKKNQRVELKILEIEE